MKKRLRKKQHKRLFVAACYTSWYLLESDDALCARMRARPGLFARRYGFPSRDSRRVVQDMKRLGRRWAKAGDFDRHLARFLQRFGFPLVVGHHGGNHA